MTNNNIRRIGILTGGGDCPGINAVIRAVTKTAFVDHKWEVFGIEDGFLGLIENRVSPLRWTDVSNILTRGGTILGTSNKANPARYAVGKNDKGEPIFEDVREKVMQHYRQHELDAVVVIGGDGTMTCAASMIPLGFNCVGVPKTIDNDLMHTNITFGFLTAVEIATEALDRLHTTAASHHRVIVVEVMGRNAGWIALHAGLASGSDIILIPEIPYDLAHLCEICKSRMHLHRAFTIVCVSEGARPKDGQQTVSRSIADSHDPIRLGGVAHVLQHQLEECSGTESRSVVLGHIQRGGTPCAADRVLATRFGHAAIDLLANGKLNRMVVIQHGQSGDVPITEVAGKQRLIEPNNELLRVARSVGTSFGG
ncbi:MAG TPA: ATP-dependent 6-phosphofructokinase [Phycisphaerae bacterium]|nr:ATP-dependent 6-phosphofructokinase [Phycisphaerae bacterium]